MTSFVFANNVSTTLATAINATVTTLTLSSSANLPASIPSGSYFVLTLSDAATRQNFEIVYAPGPQTITGGTINVIRAQEGTTALSWLVGDYVFSPPTAGQMQSFGTGSYVPLSGDSTVVGKITYAPTSGNATQTLNAPVAGSTYAGVLGQSVGSNRWLVQYGDASAQSGSNNGADFVITRYSDAGTTLGAALTITRSTGAVTLSAGLTAASVTAPTGAFATSLACGPLTSTGSISGTTGTFSGAVSSVGLSGTTATFSGALTCLTMNATGSDRNLKKKIRKVDPRPLHRSIPFVSYEMKDSGHKGLGAIAQKVQAFEPIYVGTFDYKGKERLSIDKASMAYEQAMWAGQEIDRLHKIIAALTKRLDKLK